MGIRRAMSIAAIALTTVLTGITPALASSSAPVHNSAGISVVSSVQRDMRIASFKPHEVDGVMAFASYDQGKEWFAAHSKRIGRNSGQMCTTTGTTFCARDQGDVNGSTPIVSGNHISGGGTAVNMMLNDDFTTFMGAEVYEIQFSSHTGGYCWALQGSAGSSNSNMLTRFCTAYGTAWARAASGIWINRGATNAGSGDDPEIMCQLGGIGKQMFVDPQGFLGTANCSYDIVG